MTTIIDASETETNGVTTETKKPRASKRPPWTADPAPSSADTFEIQDRALESYRTARALLLETEKYLAARLAAVRAELGVDNDVSPQLQRRVDRLWSRDEQPRKPRASKPTPGRLPRRSSEDITAAASKVIELVKKAGKAGLRSEQIRAALKLDKREMPGVLKGCLEVGALKTRGQKRATTYFAK